MEPGPSTANADAPTANDTAIKANDKNSLAALMAVNRAWINCDIWGSCR
jgi:hypothetical protein